MEKKTAQALEKSIKHWERNAKAYDVSNASVGTNDCALCGLFYEQGCDGCPISVHAGKTTCENTPCENTPYLGASYTYSRWRSEPENGNLAELFREKAKEELDFLVSLRAEPT